jgi:hypothetical protein
MRCAFALLAVAFATSVHADTSLCGFSGGRYDIEFTGEAPGDMIYLHSPSRGPGPLPLRAGMYRLRDFDAPTREVDLVFTNPGDARYPPSFTLRGRGANVWLTSRHERVRGELRCEWTPPGPRRHPRRGR